ncbi:MAG: hypothetical protein GC202_10350 [Alphaproteobacteria bacterium]|nr:hypothetical protein [Alphaproteobacteria bacterium]
MQWKIVRLAVVVTVAAFLPGCETLFNSIYREPLPDRNISVITDAKQRAILQVKQDTETKSYDAAGKLTGSTKVTGKVVMCAEPSPDVAQAISAALSISASVEKIASIPSGSSGEDKRGTGVNLGYSTASSVAQLGERLATIQLLRDKMYRACEAYANGAVGPTGYTLMLARLDKTMATMLSGELAAGAFGRALAQIATSASANGGVSETALQAARDKVKAKSDALVTAAKEAEGTDRTAHVDAAGKAFAEATTELLALERAVAVSASGASAAATTVLGNIAGRPTGATGDIAAIHRAFLDDDGIEPLVDACVTAMDLPPGGDKTVFAMVAAKSADLIAKSEELQTATTDAKNKSASLKTLNNPTPEARAAAEAAFDTANAEAIRIKDALIAQAYMQYGLHFPAFCQQNVLSANSPFVAARISAKRELREIDLKRAVIAAANGPGTVCQSLMADGDYRKYVVADGKDIPDAARALIEKSCGIKLAPKPAPEKPKDSAGTDKNKKQEDAGADKDKKKDGAAADKDEKKGAATPKKKS